MTRRAPSSLVLVTILLALACRGQLEPKPARAKATPSAKSARIVALPAPRKQGGRAFLDLLAARRSSRSFSGARVPLAHASQLLWAAQGITSARGGRTAPSAGALYPIELYLVASRVDGLPAGVYHYRGAAHVLALVKAGDYAARLSAAALAQQPIADAALSVVVTGAYDRTAIKYGERARRYVQIEVGHVGQNVLLQATALGLAAVPIGAFDDAKVKRLLGTPYAPLYIMPLGRPK